MATMKLNQIYDPAIWNPQIAEKAKELNAFLRSGAAVNTDEFDQYASGPGITVDLPFWKALDTSGEPDYYDDSDNNSTPDDMDQSYMKARKAFLHKSWGVKTIVREVQGLEDPIDHLTTKIGGYWATVDEKRILQSCLGILADSVANHSGDMVVDIATDSSSSITDAERIGPEAIINATATMGDLQDGFAAIAMHSVCYARLKKIGVLDYKETTDPRAFNGVIPVYNGLDVIVDDSMPVTQGTNRYTYTSILFSRAAIAIGFGDSEYPTELERDPDTGRGGGADILHARQIFLGHIKGYRFTSSSVSGQSPTLAELANASNWTRVYDERKHIPIAFLKTNG